MRQAGPACTEPGERSGPTVRSLLGAMDMLRGRAPRETHSSTRAWYRRGISCKGTCLTTIGMRDIHTAAEGCGIGSVLDSAGGWAVFVALMNMPEKKQDKVLKKMETENASAIHGNLCIPTCSCATRSHMARRPKTSVRSACRRPDNWARLPRDPENLQCTSTQEVNGL